MSIFETKDQKELAKSVPTTYITNTGTTTLTYQQLQEMQYQQQMQTQQEMQLQRMQYEQMMMQRMSGIGNMQAPPSPSKINEALDFKDWVRDTLPDVWDQYRAVKDIERCSK